MTCNPNDPAYLVETVNIDGSSRSCGLTKREYFAGMAMQGIISSPQWINAIKKVSENSKKERPYLMAKLSLSMADALIAELNK